MPNNMINTYCHLLLSFCRGWAANTIKVVPQNAIRLVSYETLKALLQVKKSKTDT